MFILLLIVSSSGLSSQSDVSADESQITKLLTGLSDHSVKPSEVLDPSLTTEKRASNLAYLADPSYELSVVPAGPIQINADGSATVPVRVQFKNANKEVSTESTAEFVKRNQVWYFADFGFLSFPTVIIVVIVICGLVGISFATGVLLLRAKLRRQRRSGRTNRVLMSDKPVVGRVAMLRGTLEVLASDAEAQLAHLKELGVLPCVDELALEYDDTAAASDTMLSDGEINDRQRDCIDELSEYLKNISGEANRELWTPEALVSAKEWMDVRWLAVVCLRSLDERAGQ